MPLEVFTRRNFAADFFFYRIGFYQQKLKFTGKNSKIAFCATLLRDLGVTYTVHLWRVVDFLLALIELFSLALTVEAL